MARDDQLDRTPDEILEWVRRRTPARVIVGRFGGSYPTESLLDLRTAHAAAKDAVMVELDFARVLGPDVLVVETQARSKEEYLLRPDLGRTLDPASADEIRKQCVHRPTFQIVIGDGLSATAVEAQVPQLLPRLVDGARRRQWSVGTTFGVRHCRVAVLNDIGTLLDPEVVVLLIGERPGLATAESLSAYMAYRPRSGHTDADRNLISNIHARGTPPDQAAQRILALAEAMLARKLSGPALKEELPGAPQTLRDANAAK